VDNFLGDEDLWHIMSDPHFNPKQWRRDQAATRRPIVGFQLPRPLQERLVEIHRALLIGNCLAVIAMTRAVLHYALLDNAARYEVESIEWDKKVAET